ncbi:hypothetical protein DP42_5644 [Burkholderia pseudomallei]|nr:hypothetical protein DP42_5644 [Burkholderia pseudomallei]
MYFDAAARNASTSSWPTPPVTYAMPFCVAGSGVSFAAAVEPSAATVATVAATRIHR